MIQLNIQIINAQMHRNEDKRFIGKVECKVEGHRETYEVTLESKNMKDWGYSLLYLNESGPDGEIEALDQYLEDNDEAFDLLVDAAEKAYNNSLEDKSTIGVINNGKI